MGYLSRGRRTNYSEALRARLFQTLTSYASHGIVWGGELLLAPELALKLVDNLRALGIVILGADTWHYVDPDDHAKGIVDEALLVNHFVPEAILNSSDNVAGSAAHTRDFIEQGLLPQTDLVSLVLRVPADWKANLEETPF